MPDNTNERLAIEQLRKVISRGAQGQSPIQGVDVVQDGELPGAAHRRLMGMQPPLQQDIELPVDDARGPMNWLRQMANGTFFGVKEQRQPVTPDAIVYNGNKRIQ